MALPIRYSTKDGITANEHTSLHGKLVFLADDGSHIVCSSVFLSGMTGREFCVPHLSMTREQGTRHVNRPAVVDVTFECADAELLMHIDGQKPLKPYYVPAPEDDIGTTRAVPCPACLGGTDTRGMLRACPICKGAKAVKENPEK